MKKSIILALAILPFTGLVSIACAYSSEFRCSITVTLDKTEASKGDTVTATVVWKNLNYDFRGDFEAELPNWIANKDGKSVEDMLYAVFTSNEDFNWNDELASYDHTPVERPKILIKKDAVITKEFKHTITEPEDLVVHAASFYLLGWGRPYNPEVAVSDGFGEQTETIKIKVQ